MPNRNYVKGRNRENYIKRKCEAQGYACIRSSASRGPVDIIAIRKGPLCEKTGRHCPEIRAVQVKPRGYKARKDERERMRAWSEATGIEVTVE
jgi:hypothetical protein